MAPYPLVNRVPCQFAQIRSLLGSFAGAKTACASILSILSTGCFAGDAASWAADMLGIRCPGVFGDNVCELG